MCLHTQTWENHEIDTQDTHAGEQTVFGFLGSQVIFNTKSETPEHFNGHNLIVDLDANFGHYSILARFKFQPVKKERKKTSKSTGRIH